MSIPINKSDKKYHKISNEIKQLIILNVIQKKRSLNEVSSIFNVPRSTVWNIVNNFKKEKNINFTPKLGGRKRKFSQTENSEIIKIVNSNPQNTLNKIKLEFEQIHPDKKISITTIHTIVKKELSNKKLKNEYENYSNDYFNQFIQSKNVNYNVNNTDVNYANIAFDKV